MVESLLSLRRTDAGRQRSSAAGKHTHVRQRPLRLERLEGRNLLSGVALGGIGAGATDYEFQVVAKAQPDEWFNGVGNPYVPLGEQQPGDEGQPKVNQS